MKIFNFFIFLLFTQISFAQPKTLFDSTTVRQEVLEYTDSIRGKYNMGEWYGANGYIILADGLSGAISAQYNIYNRMKRITTKSEWTNLLNHPYPEIRYYAFQTLIALKEDPLLLIEQEWNDKETVMLFNGCNGSRKQMIDLYIDNIWYKLNEEEQFNMLLRCNNSSAQVGKNLYDRIKPVPSYYPVIKKEVIEKNDPKMIVLLLKYKNSEDEPIIIQALEKVFFDKSQNHTITENLMSNIYHYTKSDDFKLLLEKLMIAYINDEVNIEERALRSLFYCIAKHDKKTVSTLFQKALKAKGKVVVSPIYNAIEDDYYEDNYIKLFFELWEYQSFGNYLGVDDYSQMMYKLYKYDAKRTMQLVHYTVEKEIDNKHSREWFLAILICYQAKEYGHDYKYNKINEYLHSDNLRLQSIAMHMAKYSRNQMDLMPLYLDFLYPFASDKYKVRELVRAIHEIDNSNKILLEWYETNKLTTQSDYLNIIDALKFQGIIE